ncbi:uncharacterized protein BCR38DRAFT_98530 [Pseudomassariella vexata]|uniref:Uncharacterized protein n=1 Tax=Pseudomassariella vexata TaxID=1141098 RepID=A0A1Y2EFH0_9PEZI|nr:uncharacterized protein BCR38DRAFT_98530 [Pseudomassariella vexata]ORY70054.1 hypothetical protein BCR38DRAFT_98530 [Pseudomassariella vexata]
MATIAGEIITRIVLQSAITTSQYMRLAGFMAKSLNCSKHIDTNRRIELRTHNFHRHIWRHSKRRTLIKYSPISSHRSCRGIAYSPSFRRKI